MATPVSRALSSSQLAMLAEHGELGRELRRGELGPRDRLSRERAQRLGHHHQLPCIGAMNEYG